MLRKNNFHFDYTRRILYTRGGEYLKNISNVCEEIFAGNLTKLITQTHTLNICTYILYTIYNAYILSIHNIYCV